MLEAVEGVTFAIDRLYDTFSDARTIVAAKLRLLADPLPFTPRDEIELHHRIISNVDAGIAAISALQKFGLQQRLDFPIDQDLLRIFRNKNHHKAYLPFKPIRCFGVTEFYFWPLLQQFDTVKLKYQDWATTPRALTLIEHLDRNQEYLAGLVKKKTRDIVGYRLHCTISAGLRHRRVLSWRTALGSME